MAEKPLVLIVDDHVAQLRLLEITLAKLGFRTLIAEHPRDALELLKEHTPSLVVLDVHLPDMSGIDLAGRIRGVSRLSATSLLLVTSEKTRAVVDQAEWEGVRTVLQKPVNTRDLETVVRALVPSLPAPAHELAAASG